MQWQYWLEEITFSGPDEKEEIENQLNELGGGGWEAVSTWLAPEPTRLARGTCYSRNQSSPLSARHIPNKEKAWLRSTFTLTVSISTTDR